MIFLMEQLDVTSSKNLGCMKSYEVDVKPKQVWRAQMDARWCMMVMVMLADDDGWLEDKKLIKSSI